VSAWVADPTTNFGLALIADTGTAALHFDSSEAGAGFTPPRLDLTYRLP
jgi:hypothetical protein